MTLKDRKSSEEWSDCLWLISIRNCTQRGGCVERMDKNNWIKKCREIVIEGELHYEVM